MAEQAILGHVQFDPSMQPSYSWGKRNIDHCTINDSGVIRFDHAVRSIVICIDKQKMRVRFSDETEDSVTIHIEAIE